MIVLLRVEPVNMLKVTKTSQIMNYFPIFLVRRICLVLQLEAMAQMLTVDYNTKSWLEA